LVRVAFSLFFIFTLILFFREIVNFLFYFYFSITFLREALIYTGIWSKAPPPLCIRPFASACFKGGTRPWPNPPKPEMSDKTGNELEKK